MRLLISVLAMIAVSAVFGVTIAQATIETLGLKESTVIHGSIAIAMFIGFLLGMSACWLITHQPR